MSDERYARALQTLIHEPESLSDEQISTLREVDDLLGRHAGSQREAALLKAAAARHRAAMGQPPVKVDERVETANAAVQNVIISLAQPRRRIKQLESLIRSLEGRVLELEARDAARTVPHGQT